jgi:hypothetical protein
MNSDHFSHADVSYLQPPCMEETAEPLARIGTAGDLILYIADMTSELATMARQANLEVAAYLLEMSRLETLAALENACGQSAESDSNASRPPESRSRRPARSSSKVTR